MIFLNRSAADSAQALMGHAERLRVAVLRIDGTTVIDCGVEVPGGLEAGRLMAEVCMAGMGQVALVCGEQGGWPIVTVATDQPVAACMLSQYAGWQISLESFFAMGSGPMRLAAAKEELIQHLCERERSGQAVGVLESSKRPTADVCRHIANQCDISPDSLTLLVAPTSSLAGTVQVVARSVETALHKMHELGYPLERVVSGFGSAPLPPVAADDLAGIGRTNDAILYGGHVVLWVEDEDAHLAELGPKIPSSASQDHGRPFAEIFKAYNHDFYAIDPLLFSPAVVQLNNLSTGRLFTFGQLEPKILAQSP